tara:strand:+ start:53 stop:535 length:483 start_codon:yes stop_codon:yes gene_type:complete
MNKNKIKILISDFDGVFTDNKVFIDENGKESVRCCRSDGIGINLLKKSGVEFIVCTSEIVKIAEFRAKKIGFQCFSNVLEKGEFISRFCEEKKINLANVAYLGNDINDKNAMEKVGLSICVKDSYKSILSMTNHILISSGGDGAVREACDYVMEWNRKID